MKTTIIAVTCAIGSFACAGSTTPPPQDPSSANAETPGDPTASSTASTTYRTETPSTTGPKPAAQAGATSMMGPGSSPPVVSPAPAPAFGPSVTTNPGAGDNTGGADNTRINARDRNGTLTPIDQGNSKAEIGITASIRRGVMGDHSLSFTAKNVKIITVGTRVTLRGPVKSDAERTEIENLARQTAGVTDVDDQLEVKN